LCQYKIQTREHISKYCPKWKCQLKALWATVLQETSKLPGPARGRNCTKIAELLADGQCSQTVLDSLATTDVGRTANSRWRKEGEGAASETSEWEDREREEQLALAVKGEEERLGGEE